MPNTQTSVPAFTSGQVLTAQQMMDVNTGIPVFATTTTRDAAFGGTGEKTLSEGQFAYIEASNTTQYYDGSAWQTLGGGLQYITGATVTSATSFSLPNSTFTSSYRNYRIVWSATFSATGTLTMRLRASGTDVSSANYQNVFAGRLNDNSALTVNDAGTTSATIGYQANSSTQVQGFILDVFSPQLSTFKAFHFSSTTAAASGAFIGTVQGGGCLNVTTACDALSIISSAASSITGTYRVYGYSDN